MSIWLRGCVLIGSAALLATASPAIADPFHFSTGNPDGLIATGSGAGTETADDFVLTQNTAITGGTFTGLLPANSDASSVAAITVEIYQIFPLDSVNPPSGAVPTRVNSPADTAFASVGSSGGGLTFGLTTLGTFSASNSVVTGINPLPNVLTGGDGAVSGQEAQFSFSLTTPLDLDAGHYFFVPEVELTSGQFLWLSAPHPVVSPGTPFPPGSTDLQSWIRDDNLSPDWLRVGTDITQQGPFNAAFSLSGVTTAVPEPASWTMMIAGFAGLGLAFRGRRRNSSACA